MASIEVLKEGRNFLVKKRLELVKKLDYYDKEITKVCHEIETLELERNKAQWLSRRSKQQIC